MSPKYTRSCINIPIAFKSTTNDRSGKGPVIFRVKMFHARKGTIVMCSFNRVPFPSALSIFVSFVSRFLFLALRYAIARDHFFSGSTECTFYKDDLSPFLSLLDGQKNLVFFRKMTRPFQTRGNSTARGEGVKREPRILFPFLIFPYPRSYSA